MKFISNVFNAVTTNYLSNAGAIAAAGALANINDNNYFAGTTIALVSVGLLYSGYRQIFGKTKKVSYNAD